MAYRDDVERLNAYTKDELIGMYLQLEEYYADKSHLVDLVISDLNDMRDICLKYLDDKMKLRKENLELKREKE